MNALPQSWLAWKEVDERLIYTALLIIAFLSTMRGREEGCMAHRHRRALALYDSGTHSAYDGQYFAGIWTQRLHRLLLVLGATGDGLVIALAPIIFNMAD